MNKKDLIVAVLFTFCLTATLLMTTAIPSPLLAADASPLLPDVAVTNVTSPKTVICHNCLGNITVTVENQGETTETFNVTVYPDLTQIYIQEITLASGESADMVFQWQGGSKGNYTIKAVADVVLGEIDVEDNTYIDGWIIVSGLGDLTGPDGWPDNKVDIRDIALVCISFGAIKNQDTMRKYYENPDIVYDGQIDIKDIATIARNFGVEY